MKIFLNNLDLTVPTYALTAKLDGYYLQALAGSLLWNDGYNGSYVVEIRNTIKKLGKPVNIAVVFGKFSHNSIYNKFPYLEFVRKHHKNPANPPVPMKIPVAYYSETHYDNILKKDVTTYPYLEKLDETIEFLADELKKDSECYDLIDAVTITGINEATKEMRITAADWTVATSLWYAYIDAAVKWQDAGYTIEKTVAACKKTIDIFQECFADKKIILPYIPLLNGFPCVDFQNNVCNPNKRFHITQSVIDYGEIMAPNFRSQYTAFTDKTVTSSKYVQVNRDYYKDKTTAEFQAMIDYAIATGVENLEIHPENIVDNPSIFK